MADRGALAHLLRRATFGPRPEDVDAAERAGFDATVDALLAPQAPDAGAARTPVPQLGADPVGALGRNPTREARQQAQQQRRQQGQALAQWWLARLVAADHQLHEKLAFFWHGHWATSIQKVSSAQAMLAYQQTLRRTAVGDFAAQTKAMLRDPALIHWLDGQRNTRQAPNENLARELMELFTLGIGNYTEDDVKQAARALTGWRIDLPKGTATLDPRRYDAGTKTILGGSGTFDTDGLAELLLAQPVHAEFVAARLWFRFASDQPMPAATKDRLVAAYRPGRDPGALLRALFTDAEFAKTRGHLVKQPVEWAVGAMRQLGVRPEERTAEQQRQLLSGLDQLGQVPLRPPSVGGWPSGAAWLTTTATQVRLRVAATLAAAAAKPVVDALSSVRAEQRIDALARLLVVDGFAPRTREALSSAGNDSRRLIALGLASPEYTVS
jgi:uncharacterized protein (DUF1800 family)